MLRARLDINEFNNRKGRALHNFKQVDDVWTLLAREISLQLDCKHAQVLYEGPPQKHKYFPNFIERWVQSFKSYKIKQNPDIIFARGGFPFYHSILNQFPQAFKIYYGAGRRFLPQSGFKDYNLILVDTPSQLKKARKKYPTIHSTLLIKPCADTIFRPIPQGKKYDIAFVANAQQKRMKNHHLVFSLLAGTKYKILQIGYTDKEIKVWAKHYGLNIYFTEKISRKKLAKKLNQCKISIVANRAGIDSCPRVIPESLACGVPVLLLDSVQVWKEKYITKQTGKVTTVETFKKDLKWLLKNYQTFKAADYYKKELSLPVAANHIIKEINKIDENNI